jgi:hypothetical protein
MGKRTPTRHVAPHVPSTVRTPTAVEKKVVHATVVEAKELHHEEIQEETVKGMAYHGWKHLVSMLESFVLFTALGAFALVSDNGLAWAQTHWPHVPHWKYVVWELADDGLFVLDVVNILYSIGKKLFK